MSLKYVGYVQTNIICIFFHSQESDYCTFRIKWMNRTLDQFNVNIPPYWEIESQAKACTVVLERSLTFKHLAQDVGQMK